MRKNLIEQRVNKGYTQEQLAQMLNIARSTYAGYESGNFDPSFKVAVKLKEILEYENDDIFLNFNVS